MDELLDLIDKQNKGGDILGQQTNTKFNTAAFDDIVITAEKEVDLPLLFQQTKEFLRSKGMEINIKKSKCLSTMAIKKKITPRTKPPHNNRGRSHPDDR